MRVSGKDYINGAVARINAARSLYDNRRFAEAIYLAGVAVECVLRAFTTRTDEAFDGRHDLRRLMKAATIERFAGERKRKSMATALGEVWARWKNNYRYVGDIRLRSEIKRLGLDRGIKGDTLKENARVVIENALIIVNKGIYEWKTK